MAVNLGPLTTHEAQHHFLRSRGWWFRSNDNGPHRWYRQDQFTGFYAQEDACRFQQARDKMAEQEHQEWWSVFWLKWFSSLLVAGCMHFVFALLCVMGSLAFMDGRPPFGEEWTVPILLGAGLVPWLLIRAVLIVVPNKN